MADLINIVVCAEQTEFKVNIKNKIDPEKLEIIGYSEFNNEAKTRILGYAPDVVIFAAESADIDDDFFGFIEDMELASLFYCVLAPIVLSPKDALNHLQFHDYPICIR